MVLDVRLEMLRKIGDARRQQRDLDLGDPVSSLARWYSFTRSAFWLVVTAMFSPLSLVSFQVSCQRRAILLSNPRFLKKFLPRNPIGPGIGPAAAVARCARGA